MGLGDVASTEDVVRALLEYLVDPLLPFRFTLGEPPPPPLPQQCSVAKQVHAVVLLYNYYHRKHHPELHFLNFDSFRKLLVDLKPAMMLYMNHINRSDSTKLADDQEDRLSVTERAIMDACNIAVFLDASKEFPSTEGWPIYMISVLLIDSRKEKCFLRFGSVTDGVWSVLERVLVPPELSLENSREDNVGEKRKRASSKSQQGGHNSEEAGFRKIVFAVVQEVTGIAETQLDIVDSYVTYCLSKERTNTRFYVVKCPQSHDHFEIPIKDIIESSKGPLVTKHSGSWTVTSVVEHYRLLPYAGFFTGALSRTFQEMENSSSMTTPEKSGRDQVIASFCINARDPKPTLAKPTNEDCHSTHFFDHSGGSDNVDLAHKCEDKSKKDHVAVHHFKRKTSSVDHGMKASFGGTNIKEEMAISVVKPVANECGCKNIDMMNEIGRSRSFDQLKIVAGDSSLAPSQSGTNCPENLYNVLESKNTELTQTALRALLKKREKLSHQVRNTEDEIALCNKSIKTILDGNDDDFSLKLEAVIDFCNGVFLKENPQLDVSNHQGSIDIVLGKSLSGAILKSPCQELDGICLERKWMLPRYRLVLSDGGFVSDVVINGVDFQFREERKVHASPVDARESAASYVIAKLRNEAN